MLDATGDFSSWIKVKGFDLMFPGEMNKESPVQTQDSLVAISGL